MSGDFSALRGLRVGCVKYLNSRPLIHAYDGSVVFEHPSVLAAELAAGRLDAALVPVFEALQHPGYSLVDGVAVGCRGAVYSVFLAHRGPLAEVRSVALDPASLSSAHLLRVLLAEFHGLAPSYGREGEARLIIGNQAIEFREDPANAGWEILDLGAEWLRCTGLPFVFALWVLRAGLPGAVETAEALRGLKAAGLPRMAEIVASDPLGTPELRRRYLTEHIHFDLTAEGKSAIARYAALLAKHGYLAAELGGLRFV